MRFAVFDSLALIRSEDSGCIHFPSLSLERCQFEWTATVAGWRNDLQRSSLQMRFAVFDLRLRVGLWVTVAIAISGGGF
jgi:hypothetical protein